MAIYKDGKEISDIYIGSNAISEIYKGSDLIYQSRYPSGTVLFQSGTPGTYTLWYYNGRDFQLTATITL